MRKSIFFLMINSCLLSYAQKSSKVDYFPLKQVRLLQSPFQKAMFTDKKYMMELDVDRLLSPYLKEANLPTKKENYPNWENTGLDGHIGGHYLSALSLMYASTGDLDVKKRLDYMVDQLEICQNNLGTGYLSGVSNGKTIWNEIEKGDIRAASFGLNDRWVPLYNIHKIYAGLKDAYVYADNEKAKKMLIKLTDWMLKITSQLSDAQIQEMLKSEHGGLNETFADVYEITKDPRYLTLAKRFSDQRILNPLLEGKDELTGMHANTQIPKVIGYKRIADLEQNKNWNKAADLFWHNVTENRSSVIGGNSVSEHFNPTQDFSGMMKSIEGPETCNSYNMLKLSKQLFATNPNVNYINYYEKTLYNHILSTQHAENGGFVYFTPMRPGHYRVYSQPHTSFWCCVGSGLENHAKYGEMIYAHTENELYVNLFIPSSLSWEEKGFVIQQENNFPNVAETNLIIKKASQTPITLKLRKPDWALDAEVEIWVNNKKIAAQVDAKGYYNVNQKWKKGDAIKMKLPMHISVEQLPDHSDYYAYKYGPLVLASKWGNEKQDGLFADDSRGGHVANGPQIPLQDIPMILGDPKKVIDHLKLVDASKLTFKLSDLYPNKQYENGVELVPFNSIQAERYIIYFPQATQDKVADIQNKRKEEENAQLALDAVTVDKIQLGEQQPESDHFFESKDSNSGYMEDMHYREASGWFSYRMKNTALTSKFLVLRYFDLDANRILKVEINGELFEPKLLAGKSGVQPQTFKIELSKKIKQSNLLKIKFLSEENKNVAKIIDLRLVSK